MSSEKPDSRITSDEVGVEAEPRHFSREPWWVVPFAGFVVALLTLVNYGKLKQRIPGIGLREAMLTAGGFGMAAAAVLVIRSHVRSVIWSTVLLWAGILGVTIGICIVTVR